MAAAAASKDHADLLEEDDEFEEFPVDSMSLERPFFLVFFPSLVLLLWDSFVLLRKGMFGGTNILTTDTKGVHSCHYYQYLSISKPCFLDLPIRSQLCSAFGLAR
jgi:hypothetical protein